MEHAEEDEEDTGQKGGYRQALEAVLLNDAIYNNNERARGASYLHLRTAEDRYDQSGDDGSDDALLRSHAGGDTEGNGQGQGYDADDDARQQVSGELFPVVILQRRKQFRFKL